MKQHKDIREILKRSGTAPTGICGFWRMWPINLSVRLLIVDLVGRYLTNYLIRREAIPKRIAPFPSVPCGTVGLCGISSRFQLLSPTPGQVPHALLTRSPLSYKFVIPK